MQAAHDCADGYLHDLCGIAVANILEIHQNDDLLEGRREFTQSLQDRRRQPGELPCAWQLHPAVGVMT